MDYRATVRTQSRVGVAAKAATRARRATGTRRLVPEGGTNSPA